MPKKTGTIIGLCSESLLFDNRHARTIGEMAIGEVGYCVPWAVDGLKIREDCDVCQEPGGTVQIAIKCVGEHEYVIGI